MKNRYFTDDAFMLMLAIYAGAGLLAFLIVWSA
jgi:hypothetical protein